MVNLLWMDVIHVNFIKRAGLTLVAKKGRTALLVLVTTAIMLFVLAGLLIRNAANTATATAKANVGATLTLSQNRAAAFKTMRSSSQSGSKPTLTQTPVKLSLAKQIARIQHVASYAVTVTTSANASGFDAITTRGTTGGFGGRGPATTSGDITISGVTSTASATAFNQKTASITQGRGLTKADANSHNVVIESELAKQNSLSVGDTIKLKATTGSKATTTLTIVGIYKAKSTSTGMPGESDPANTVYTGYGLANQVKGSKYVNTADNVTFTVSAPSQVAAVKKAAKQLINTSKYSITSDDQNYQLVKSSMATVSGFANKIVWLVAIAGTIILALIVILMIRERRHEIGVLLALGEARWKIIGQFLTELFVVLLVGIGLAAAGGKVVGDQLAQQVVATQTTQSATTGQFGRPGGPSGQGKQLPGGGQQTAKTNQAAKQTKLATHVTVQALALLFALGLGIILVAILIAAAGILRLQPKNVLIE